MISRRAMLSATIAFPFTVDFARSSSAVDRVMVQGRPQDSASLYKVRNIMPALDALGGIRKMRCRCPFPNTIGWNTYAGLARSGVKFCFTLPAFDPALLISYLTIFEQQNPGSIWAIEFPNEPDLNPVTYRGITDQRLGARMGDAPALMAFCQSITAMLSNSSQLASVPRVAFNDWMPTQQKGLVNYANSHIYPRPDSPSFAWLTHWRQLLAASGLSQGLITEWGRSTGGDTNNHVAPPVTLDQQAKLLESDLSLVLSEKTVNTISIYELFCWPGSGEQENFGVFNSDLTPRPAVHAIRSLLR